MESQNRPKPLIGRLVFVPLVIVVVMVGCAVVVVLSFGWIASSKAVPITRLLTTLEASSGDRAGGALLMPRDKELWQAAQELALRLENLEAEIAPEQLPEIQDRLVRLLEQGLSDPQGQDRIGRRKLFFIMSAAAKSRAPQAVPLLLSCIRETDDGDLRREALRALACMGAVPEARAAAGQVAQFLVDPDPVVAMATCAVLTNLAKPGDRIVGSALRASLKSSALEVRWNAALALARLDMADGLEARILLADMLSREYWRKQRANPSTADGSGVDRFPANRIDHYLVTALDATTNLVDDEDVAQRIEDLTRDRSLAVANKAKQVLASRVTYGNSAVDGKDD